MTQILFQVHPWDPVAFGAVVAVLCLANLFACWGPALRPSRPDPVLTLREP